MSLATRMSLALRIELGSMALSDGSVVIAARSAGVQVAVVVGVALAVALGLLVLLDGLLLPHAASSATTAIASRAATDHRARRRVDLRGTR